MLTLHVHMYPDRHLAFLVQFLTSVSQADRLYDSNTNIHSCCEHSLVRVESVSLVGEMVQWLGTLTELAEDLGWALTEMVAHNCL